AIGDVALQIGVVGLLRHEFFGDIHGLLIVRDGVVTGAGAQQSVGDLVLADFDLFLPQWAIGVGGSQALANGKRIAIIVQGLVGRVRTQRVADLVVARSQALLPLIVGRIAGRELLHVRQRAPIGGKCVALRAGLDQQIAEPAVIVEQTAPVLGVV